MTQVSDRRVGWLLLVGGLIGAVAAFVLTLERIALLRDPSYVPSCSINPVLSCGSVMTTDQAAIFGFPNPLIGVAAFPVVAATGAALLAGARLARWYWLALQVGVLGGAVMVGWLFFQSLYRINALCPYCMVVWLVVVPIAVYVTRRNALAGVFGEGLAANERFRSLSGWTGLLLALIAAGAVLLILEQFWSYWSTLL